MTRRPDGAEAEAALLAQTLSLEDELQRMTGELIETQDQLLAVFDLLRATRRRLSLDAVLADLVGEVRRLTAGERAFAVLGLDPYRRLVCDPEPVAPEQVALIERLCSWTRESGAPFLSNSPGDLPAGLPIRASVFNIAAVPVTVEAQVQAALGVLNRPNTALSAGTIKLLQALAEQAGALIESAVLHEQALARERLLHEMKLAAEIQAGLMEDHAPQVPGLEIVGQFRPAADVGGDFYDFRLRADGKLAFNVGDVSGKGIGAALVMGISRTVLRGATHQLGRPAQVLDRANVDLYEDLTRVTKFVTAFTGFYLPHDNVLWYASAGHSPVVYCPANGPARLLVADSLPLGILPQTAAVDRRLPLGPGDVLVVATDGFSEATNRRGELFGYDRLLRLVEAVAGDAASVAGRRLFAAVKQFGDGRPQDDDQTLVLLRGRPV